MLFRLPRRPHRMPPPLRALLVGPARQLLADDGPPATLSILCFAQLVSLLLSRVHAAARDYGPLCSRG